MPRLSLILPFISQKRSFGSVFFWGRCASGVGLLLLGLAWLVPDHYPPWTSFHSEMLAFMAITLFFVARLVAAGGLLAWPRWAGLLVFAALVPWLQWAFGLSTFAGDALVVTLYLVGLLAAVAVGYSHASAKAPVDASLAGVMHVLWGGALLSAGIGLLQWLALEDVLGDFAIESTLGGRALGNLAQTNHLSTLLLMGCVALAYGFERRLIRRSVLLLGVAFLTLVLVLTASRSGLVGLVVIAVYLAGKHRHSASRLPVRAVAAWALGFLAMTWMLPYVSQALLIGDGGLSLSSTSGRAVMWRQIAYGIAEQPWLGYGWNLTARAQMAGVLVLQGSLSTNYAHNLLLDLLVWNGIPLGMLFIAAGVYWFVTRVWRVRGTDAVYAMACLMPILVHSMVEYPFAYGYFLLPAGIMVGVIEASFPSNPVFAIRKRIVAAYLLLWVVAGGYFVYEYFLIEEDFRITRFENMRVGKTPVDYDVPTIRMPSHMAAMLRASRVRATPGLTPEAMENLKEVSDRFAFSVLNYRYALALGLNGDPEGASRELAVIRGLYGANHFRGVVEDFEEMSRRYPQLKAVKIP